MVIMRRINSTVVGLSLFGLGATLIYILGRLTDPSRLHHDSLDGNGYFPGKSFHPHSTSDTNDDNVVPKSNPMTSTTTTTISTGEVTLALAVCADLMRLRQATTMLTSVILSARHIDLLKVLVTCDEVTCSELTSELLKLRTFAKKFQLKFDFQIHEATFPGETPEIRQAWKNSFRVCATQRLFYPYIFPTTDAVLHVDTDIIFLSNVKELWDHFGHMDGQQLAGMAQEYEVPMIGHYDNQTLTPYYGPRGVNAGVMLMNLTRMRKADFLNQIMLIVDGFREGRIKYADQYLIYDISCAFNYRTDHCLLPVGGCRDAELNGISVLHANRNHFEPGGPKFMRNIFILFENFDLTQKNPQSRRVKLIKKLWSDYAALGSAGGTKQICYKVELEGSAFARMLV